MSRPGRARQQTPRPRAAFDRVALAGAALACLLASGGALAQDAPAPGEAVERELTLDQAVRLALTDNRDLADARTYRALDKFDLEEAENYFRPKLSLSVGAGYRNSPFGTRRLSSSNAGVFPGMTISLPTGGAVGVSTNLSANVRSGDWSESTGLSVSLYQPLLKGGGLAVGRAPVIQARLAEERKLLSFRATIMDTVTTVIKSYRSVMESELHHRIAVQALARANKTLEVNRLLINAGRIAEQDIALTEANIASRELSVVLRQTALDDAKRRLGVLLDLDPSVRLKLVEPLDFEPAHPDIARSQAIAQKSHTPYLYALLAIREAELQAIIARNNLRWDLALNASASFSESATKRGGSLDALANNLDMGSYAVGISLRVPLGDREANARKRAQINSRLSLERAQYRLAATVRGMEVAVRDSVRAVESGNRGVLHASQARELAEKKLDIEREKLRLGLSSTFQIATYEDDLVNAQVSELSATISHMNALTDLDRLLGTVLETWGIEAE